MRLHLTDSYAIFPILISLIYDFAIRLIPVDTVSLEELPEEVVFQFMEFENQTPVFRNNQVEVTDAQRGNG
jgi:hypothetical protein